jgi:HKD family nuclease
VRVETVTTSDQTLLSAVRSTLQDAEEAFLCVAFVQEKGLHLLEPELAALQRRKARARLLVTTTFQTTSPGALGMAARLGLEVRVLNPGAGKTFHPKLYLASGAGEARAVIGSANLTGGLFSNFEAAVALSGSAGDEPIARAWRFAEGLWSDDRVEPWTPAAAEAEQETFAPDLYAALAAEVRRDPVFMTLGPKPKPNLVARLTRAALYVATERSRRRTGGAEEIPAWMFNLAWDRLRAHGRLSNAELLNDLRVHRSSAVCAILGRLAPFVERAPGREIVLRWRGP